FVASCKQLLSERGSVRLKQWLSSSDFKQVNAAGIASGKCANLFDHFVHRLLRPAVKRVGRIAPSATKVAAREPHEYAGQPRARPLTLNGFENFGDYHGATPASNSAACFRAIGPHALPPEQINYANNRHGKLSSRDSRCQPPSPSERKPEERRDDGRNSDNEKCSVHTLHVPFWGDAVLGRSCSLWPVRCGGHIRLPHSNARHSGAVWRLAQLLCRLII